MTFGYNLDRDRVYSNLGPNFLTSKSSITHIEIEKERSVSAKLTREIVYEKRRQNTRAWADLLINCGNFMSSI